MIERLDHLVLTVADIERTCSFYGELLGMRRVTFGEGRVALAFGEQKINLHEAGAEVQPSALHPTPGSADLCFVTFEPVAEVAQRLREAGVPIEQGPVERVGAIGQLESIYFRDPDGNLVEVSNYRVDPVDA